MLNRIGQATRDWVERVDPRTNVYGVARTLLAIGTLTTLIFSPTSALFRPIVGAPGFPKCAGPAGISLFCVVPTFHLELARWLSIAILLVVAAGWRPRFTGVLHWWVVYSLMVSAVLVDGGDQVTANLAFALIPVTLIDGRRWHWGAAPAPSEFAKRSVVRFLTTLPVLLVLIAIRVQMAGIYFQSADAKTRVEEWRDGTAVYYWFTDLSFGLSPWLASIMHPVLTNGALVTSITWGAIGLEFLLFAGIVMDKRFRPWLLLAGLSFHFGIAVVHGLVSFAFAMWAGLILYLWPVERPFVIPGFALRAIRRVRLPSFRHHPPLVATVQHDIAGD